MQVVTQWRQFAHWLSDRLELSRGNAQNVKPMEGLRGFAVLLVFLVHYSVLIGPWLSEAATARGLARSVSNMGQIGVDLFFILSGYLIYGSLISRDQRFVRFMSRRIQRIYPVFLVVFLIYFGLSWVFVRENKIPPGFVRGSVYLLENLLLLPGLFPIKPMIGVAWSLSYELFYYLAIPLVVACLGMRRWDGARRGGFFLVVLVLYSFAYFVYGGHIRLVLFVAGILLYEAMNSEQIPTPSSLLGLVALLVALAVSIAPIEERLGELIRIQILCVSFFLLCLVCFRTPSAWLPRGFSWTPLRWLGNMSYSYYLLHGLALKASFLLLSDLAPGDRFGSWFFWILLPPMFLWTLIPSAVLFLCVERPFSLAPSVPARGEPRRRSEAVPEEAPMVGPGLEITR